jgi:formylglycine-generating enzyme required for sulfatase activity/serine/threonine protein kinase
VPEVAEILQQAARGLNAAHKLGIIHRDLKPDNIFLTYPDDDVGAGLVPALPVGIADTGRPQEPPLRPVVVKIVDFGIAKLRESAMHTQTGMVLGTPAYMSYEQASGMRSDELDARSDIYSLGVVVYEMLTGRTPFHSDTPVGYLRMHMQEDPPPFRAVAPGLGVPPAVEGAAMKALVKNRDQRYASVLDFARDFVRAATLPSPVESPKPFAATKRAEPAIPQSDIGAVPDRIGTGREPPLRDRGARPPAKKRSIGGIASLVAAVVVVIVVALVWVYWPGPTKPPSPQPGAPQQETTAPAKPETPAPAPSASNPQTNPPSPQVSPAQIAVQTSPNAQVYLDDTFKGQVGRKGRLVIEDLKPGDHALRVSLSGKKDYEHGVTVAAGQVATITATLADAEPLSPPAPVETPRRAVSEPAARTVKENAKDGLKYVWIPPGTFIMGCSPGDSECSADEKPAHQVTITRGFWIGQTPVTAGAYKRFAGATGRQTPDSPIFNLGWANEDMPVVDVTWDDAQAYCGWMGGRLPTEAEWEYAARGGSTQARYGNLDEIAWCSQNSGNQTWNVGQKRANGFGLYDMLGNVWEWVNDWYDQNYYQNSPSQDPKGPASGPGRVLRGGSWYGLPRFVRVSVRSRYNSAVRVTYGFRCGGEVFVP